MTAFIDPLSDERGPDGAGGGYTVYWASAERVSLSKPLQRFLIDAQFSRLRPILVTTDQAHVSSFVADAFQAAGGYWAVSHGGAMFDAFRGTRIRSFGDFWAPRSDAVSEAHPSLSRLREHTTPSFVFDVYVRDRADDRTLIGGTADLLVAGLGGGALERWGLVEPLAQRWSHAAVTESMRRQMPVTERHFAAGGDGSAVSLAVSRTKSGILEHVRGTVPVRDAELAALARDPRGSLAAHPRVIDTLRELAETSRVNVALLSCGEVEERQGSFGRLPGVRRPEQPLAVLLGARAVRDLAIDVDALAEQHDVTTVGLRRAPALIVRLTGDDPLWYQLRAFATDLDQERLASALAVEFATGDAHVGRS
ncbi:DUF6177 family protein [Pseudoclavibacter terrae]|uniref:Uncharacterized protein n=1 Tax=Pseudoclavibacter terrae TaxID=1530195 RepID=A0A7J5B1V3_9MICO|nr:DUF6177 family protein [Pseudoclavibacter terrae]KAB1637842.1 hypothetical protein F8O03_11690 [Pseudoclavibacter terrae]